MNPAWTNIFMNPDRIVVQASSGLVQINKNVLRLRVRHDVKPYPGMEVAVQKRFSKAIKR